MPDPAAVNTLFSRIAGRYDLANRLLSGGIDIHWRRHLVAQVKKQNPATLLDLATGSGDLAFALHKKLPSTQITGADFCEPMLDQARAKQAAAAPCHDTIRFQQADALALPFPDESYDALTIAFGHRNLADRPRALAEMRRVLRPSGRLYILEFSQPVAPFRPLYYFYLKHILPKFAALVTRDRNAYEYLSSSIENYPDHNGIADELRAARYRDIKITRLTLGIVALHQAVK